MLGSECSACGHVEAMEDLEVVHGTFQPLPQGSGGYSPAHPEGQNEKEVLSKDEDAKRFTVPQTWAK